MKSRTVPYGYKYDNGKIVIDTCESETVKRIFELYKNGHSLLNISRLLNEENIEYMPGITAWNKSRLMRILEDKRYLGTDTYPDLIKKEIFDYIQTLKSSNNPQKYIDRNADIFKLKVPVICSKCGSLMHRCGGKHRYKLSPCWVCTNKNCNNVIHIKDDVLLKEILDRINTVIKAPNIINIPTKSNQEHNFDVIKLENEIQLALDKVEYSKEELLNKVLKCTSQKYLNLDKELYLIRMMKKRFEQTKPLEKYSENFVNKTVKCITIKDNQSVSIELMNGQTIGKEEKSDDRNHLQSNGAA